MALTAWAASLVECNDNEFLLRFRGIQFLFPQKDLPDVMRVISLETLNA